MASLFYLPKVVSLPGSKLYFYQTGTTTPQSVYTDADLQVAHSNPVVADASGVFAPIYLDPTLPDYRVSHYTSADVLIYTADDIPSNQNVQQSMRLESTNPFLLLYDTDGTSGSRKYRVRVNGDTFIVESSNEAETVFTTLFSANGTVLTLQNNARINGNPVATYSTGTFTATLTGCTTSPTGTVTYALCGNHVILRIPAISGTSNSTSMSLTGLPSAVQVGSTRVGSLALVTDNGTASIATTSIVSPTGVINFGLGASGGTFTNSGTKGVNACVLIYENA